MEHETDAQPHETPHTRWQRRMAARPLAPVQTTWGMEYIARGTWLFPVEAALRLTADVME